MFKIKGAYNIKKQHMLFCLCILAVLISPIITTAFRCTDPGGYPRRHNHHKTPYCEPGVREVYGTIVLTISTPCQGTSYDDGVDQGVSSCSGTHTENTPVKYCEGTYDSDGSCSGFFLLDMYNPADHEYPAGLILQRFVADEESLDTSQPLCLEDLKSYYSENITDGEYNIAGCIDGYDNDCDGVRDKEDLEDCWELDKDRDGYISDEYTLPEEYSNEWEPNEILSRMVAGDDCDDLDAHTNPDFSGCVDGLMEDGTICLIDKDYNCNGIAGEFIDADNDGIPDIFDGEIADPGNNPYGPDGRQYSTDNNNLPGWN